MGTFTFSQIIYYLKNLPGTDSYYQKSFEELYNSISKVLQRCARELCQDSPFKGLEDDLVQEAFIKFLENIDAFNYELNDNDSTIRRLVISYHISIIRNDFKNLLKNKKNIKALSIERDIDLEIAEEDSLDSDDIVVEKIKKVKIALKNALSQKEQKILLAMSKFHNSIIPKHILQNLCIEFKTTPENLRQIKCRALKKVQKFLSLTGFVY